jgi:hypothetical protein
MIAVAAALLALQPASPDQMNGAFQAWTECLQNQLEDADPRMSATRMADRAMAACRRHERAFHAAHDRWLPRQGYNAAQMREARTNFRRSMETMRLQTIENARGYSERE